MEEDLCAGCEKPLTKIHETARVQCCNNGYLSKVEPLATDKWFITLKKKGLFWYKSWVRKYGV